MLVQKSDIILLHITLPNSDHLRQTRP